MLRTTIILLLIFGLGGTRGFDDLAKKYYHTSEDAAERDLMTRYPVSTLRHQFKNEIFSTEWCHTNKEIVFALEEDKTLLRSVNGGVTWQDMTLKLKQAGGAKHKGMIIAIAKNNFFNEQIVFLGSSGVSYLSEDCGESFKLLDHGKKLFKIRFHPTRKNYLLARTEVDCEGKKNCTKRMELILTKDHVKWESLVDYVQDFDWAYRKENDNKDMPIDRIFIIRQMKKKSNQNFRPKVWMKNVNFIYSDDFFKTSTTLLEGANQFAATSKFVYMLKLEDFEKQSVQLHVSEIQKDMKERQVRTPLKQTLQYGYTVLHISDSMVFVHIKTETIAGARMGDLFVTDSTGHRLSRIAKHNVRSSSSICDVVKVPSLEGVYLMNKYDDTYVEMLKEASLSGDKNRMDKFVSNLDNYKRSYITYNTGAKWNSLKPPTYRMDGKKFKCEYNCSLHLHMFSSEGIPRAYSLKNSLGLIIGHGNVGPHLSHENLGLFLSRDGGYRWYHVGDGRYIYEIGNRGAFIVMAKYGVLTNEIEFSYDFGASWIIKRLQKKKMIIKNIIMEPENHESKFLLIGNEAEESDIDSRSISYSLDFSRTHVRVCKGYSHPATKDSDFTFFSPKFGKGHSCLKGRKMVYIRRKEEAACHIPMMDEEKIVRIQNCPCTEEDWICDRDFERDSKGKCVRVDGKKVSTAPPRVCRNDYTVQSGYRKTAGNTCFGGIDHSDRVLVCPITSRILIFRNVLLLFLIGVVIYTIFVYRERFGIDYLLARIVTTGGGSEFEDTNKGYSAGNRDGYFDNNFGIYDNEEDSKIIEESDEEDDGAILEKIA